MTDNAQTINMQDNRTVVGLLRAGDEKCFDALFRRYYKPLCTYATRFVTPARAEELVQDTLMWVWENRTSLLPEMPLKSLLFTIVKNKAINHMSRDTIKNRVIRQLAEYYEEEFDDPDFYLEGELVERLTAALRKMPPEFQQTFRMHRARRQDPQGDRRRARRVAADGQLPDRADRAPAARRAERVLAARRFAVVAGPALKKYRKFPIFFEFRLASSADGLYYYID